VEVRCFYKVKCARPDFTGRIRRWRFDHGVSKWMLKRQADLALRSRNAAPVEGVTTSPYFAVMRYPWNEPLVHHPPENRFPDSHPWQPPLKAKIEWGVPVKKPKSRKPRQGAGGA